MHSHPQVRIPGDLSDEGVALTFRTGANVKKSLWCGDMKLANYELIPKNTFAVEAALVLGKAEEDARNIARILRTLGKSISDCLPSLEEAIALGTWRRLKLGAEERSA